MFPTADYKALFNGLNWTTTLGGPTFHLANYTVVTNNHQAIFGGWQVWLTSTLVVNHQPNVGRYQAPFVHQYCRWSKPNYSRKCGSNTALNLCNPVACSCQDLRTATGANHYNITVMQSDPQSTAPQNITNCFACALPAAWLAVLNNRKPLTQVEVLWIVSQRQSKWEAALPKETSDLINSARGEKSGPVGNVVGQVAGFVNEKLGTSE